MPAGAHPVFAGATGAGYSVVVAEPNRMVDVERTLTSGARGTRSRYAWATNTLSYGRRRSLAPPSPTRVSLETLDVQRCCRPCAASDRSGAHGCARAHCGASARAHPTHRANRLRLGCELLPADPAGGGPRQERRGDPGHLSGQPSASCTDDVPRRGNEPLRAGRHRRRAGGGRQALAAGPGRGRRQESPRPARCDRRSREPGAQGVPREDGAGPGVHQRLHDGRHPVQQLQRDVLRGRPERVPHAGLPHVRAPIRDDHRHGPSRRRRNAPRAGAAAGARACWTSNARSRPIRDSPSASAPST
jgi:hypothetical protein